VVKTEFQRLLGNEKSEAVSPVAFSRSRTWKNAALVEART
jgi:hypothetical protein